MTARYADGFDYLPSGLSTSERDRILAAKGWYPRIVFGSPEVTPDVRTGRFGFGKALGWNQQIPVSGDHQTYVRPVLVEKSEGFQGFAMFRGSNTQVGVSPWFGLYDAVADTPQVSVSFDINGVVRLWRGFPQSNVLLGTSKSGVFREDVWFYAELGSTIDNASGDPEVRINKNTAVIDMVSQDTQASGNAHFDAIAIGFFGAGGRIVNAAFDDGYTNDADGSVNNGFLGNVRVKTQFSAGAGAVDDFTPVGAATSWQAVLNTLLSDAKYTASPNIGDKLLVALEAIMGSAPVHFSQVCVGARQTDATQRTIRPLLALGGVEGDAGDRDLNQLFSFVESIIELSPDTGIGQTGAELNAGEAGFEIVG